MLLNRPPKSASCLKKHQRHVHDKVKDETCPICQRALNNKSELNRHVRFVHEKIKKVKCDLCEYASISASDMEKHVRHVHLTNMRRFPCDECPQVTNFLCL